MRARQVSTRRHEASCAQKGRAYSGRPTSNARAALTRAPNGREEGRATSCSRRRRYLGLSGRCRLAGRRPPPRLQDDRLRHGQSTPRAPGTSATTCGSGNRALGLPQQIHNVSPSRVFRGASTCAHTINEEMSWLAAGQPPRYRTTSSMRDIIPARSTAASPPGVDETSPRSRAQCVAHATPGQHRGPAVPNTRMINEGGRWRVSGLRCT